MRTIIRFSIDAESNSKLRNKLAKVLTDSGFADVAATATYEGDLAPATLSTALQGFWATATGHPGPGSVDHFWMYCDKPKQKKKSKKVASTKKLAG